MERLTKDQNTIANQAQTENIVKRILTSEIKYIIGIIIFLVGVVAPYYDIKQDVALIKQNHYAHIESIQKEILEIKQAQLRNEDTVIKLMEKISELKYMK